MEPAASEPAAPGKKKVLWVEDDSFLIDVIAQRLTSQEWELLYANDGAAALRVAHEKKPDVIILDILLPGIDGIEVLRQLKADESTKNIPVLMFSNLDDKEKIQEGKTLGAEGFFVKATSTLESIIEEIQKVLAK